MAINFISSKDSDDCIIMSSKTDEVIEELFEYLLQRYQEQLEESMKGSEIIFDSVVLIYYITIIVK